MVEAYGLWHARAWGEFVAAASGASYVLFELGELHRRPGLLSAGLLAVILAIVAFMVYSLKRRRTACRSG